MAFLKENGKSILLFLLVLVAVGFGYNYFFSGSSGAGGSLQTTSVVGSEGDEVLLLLLDLKGYQLKDLDQRIFADPVFRNLRNFSVELPYEKPGRANPFSPFGNIPAGATTINLRATFER